MPSNNDNNLTHDNNGAMVDYVEFGVTGGDHSFTKGFHDTLNNESSDIPSLAKENNHDIDANDIENLSPRANYTLTHEVSPLNSGREVAPQLITAVLRKKSANVEVLNTESDGRESSLVHVPYSDLTMAISNVTAASRVGLDLASFLSTVVFGTAKISTSLGLEIVKAVTGVMSDRIVQSTTRDGNGGLFFIPRMIDASTMLLHRTLSLTEQVALAGLEFTSEKVQRVFGTSSEISLIDYLFGTTDAAKALAEFVQLVKREWNFQYSEDDNLSELGTFGAFKVIKALTAWACLQCVTSEKYEREAGGWKKIKLVGLWDIRNDWVHVDYDEALYEDVELLLVEEEDDEEMVIVTQNKPKNIVVGELTPCDEVSEFKFSIDEDHARRLSDLFLDTTRRFTNPYLQENDTQTEDEKLFSLLHNLKRYSKFSSSAYDFTTAIIGQIPFPAPRSKEKGRLHRFTFARSTEIPLDSIVDSSHQKNPTSGSYQPTYFLIRDHITRSIILALRGTMSIHDLIVDLTCEYEDFQLPEDVQRGDMTKHQIHKGMYKVAKSMATPGQSGVFEALKREMEANEDYGLVLVGHSLGAGVASILALLLASPTTCMTTRWSRLPLGRKVHAYAFATPCVMSAALSNRVKTLVTSVAYGNDVVCRLSLGHVLDLRNMVRYLVRNKSKDSEAEDETISKIIKKFFDYQSRMFGNDEKSKASKEEFEKWFCRVREDCSVHMQNPKLYPAGKVFWIVNNNRAPYCEVGDEDKSDENGGIEREKSTVKERLNNGGKDYIMLEVDVEKTFQEIWFSPHMMMDHFPHFYENCLKKL